MLLLDNYFDELKIRIWHKGEKKLMYFNNPTLIDGDTLQGGLLFKNYDHKIQNVAECRPSDFIIDVYSGYIDKSAAKIYTNDIIKTDYGDIGVVKYSKHFLDWRIVFVKGRKHLTVQEEYGVAMFDFIYPKIHLKVIGNIYENKELIGG